MSYYFAQALATTFDDAVAKTTAALKDEGFGIITEIDVKETLKRKFDVDFRRYKILGACNPNLAYEALKLEDKVGTMLPCAGISNHRSDAWSERLQRKTVKSPFSSTSWIWICRPVQGRQG